jgi:hypothetical protein
MRGFFFSIKALHKVGVYKNKKKKNAVRPRRVRVIIWRPRHPVLHSSVRRRQWEKADAAAEKLAERGTDLEAQRPKRLLHPHGLFGLNQLLARRRGRGRSGRHRRGG